MASSALPPVQAFVPPDHFDLDPVASDYDTFFDVLHFEIIPERDETKPWPGRSPHPERAYVKAQLVMIREKIEYHTELRRFLVQHPAPVLCLGFRPPVDPTSPWGFDVERTVPCARHLRRKLQYGNNGKGSKRPARFKLQRRSAPGRKRTGGER